MQPLDSKPINLTEVKGTPGKAATKSQFPRVLKQYILLLIIVTLIAAIFFGIFILLEQKRFYRVEASSILSYHPERHTDMIPILSIHEILQIIRNDAVKQQVGDMVAIPQDKQKYLKEALDISYDSTLSSNNLLKVSVKWDDTDQARQLVNGYIQTAITAYVHFQTKYLLETMTEKNKAKSEFEHKNKAIEEKLAKLAQSVHSESVKQALETLKMNETRLRNELSDSQKQYSLATIQQASLKKDIPNKYDYAKLKIVSQHPDILDIIQKRNEALENYEIQKALGTETEQKVKEAQTKYRLTEDRLTKTLENLNLMEDDVISLNTVILKHVEELESLQTTMEKLEKYIEDVQYRLDQKQKEMMAVSSLLPQEEALDKQRMTTLAKLDKIENELMEQGKLELTLKKALLPLNFTNVHHINSFSLKNYVSYFMAGIAIIVLTVSVFLLENAHRKHHVKSTSSTIRSTSAAIKPPSSSSKPSSSAAKPPSPATKL
jgi:hypothetical protein